jgi:hypothetical protein
MRQVGYLQRLYRDAARSAEHKISVLISSYNRLHMYKNYKSKHIVFLHYMKSTLFLISTK